MEVVRAKHKAEVDIGEIYSPVRVVGEAVSMGLRRGFSLDLTAKRADGTAWDFSKRSCQRDALALINATRPFCVVGSPPTIYCFWPVRGASPERGQPWPRNM